jgi:anthranilate phosphoribosyltransferase
MLYEYRAGQEGAAPSTALSTTPSTTPGLFTSTEIDPSELGMVRSELGDLRGGDAVTNAGFARRVLAGERGPRRDIVVLNAAASLVVGGAASTLGEGLARAGESIDSGAAASTLDRLIEVSKMAAGL